MNFEAKGSDYENRILLISFILNTPVKYSLDDMKNKTRETGVFTLSVQKMKRENDDQLKEFLKIEATVNV